MAEKEQDSEVRQEAEMEPAVTSALALLGEENDEAVEARWKSLSDAELDSTIASYREAVDVISRALQSRGVEVSLEDEQTKDEPKAPRQNIPGVEVCHSSLPKCPIPSQLIKSPGANMFWYSAIACQNMNLKARRYLTTFFSLSVTA